MRLVLLSLSLLMPGVLPGATFIIPQIADGGGWKTTVSVVNRVNRRVQASVAFNAENGLPLDVQLAGLGTVSRVNLDLGPYESRTIESLGTGQATLVGWAQVTSDDDIGGIAVFRQRGQGRPDFEAAVPFTLPGSVVIAPFDYSQGYVTGLALVGLSQGPVNLTLVFRDESGLTISARSFTIDARNHMSFAIADMFPEVAGKKGSAHLIGSGPPGTNGNFAALGLRFSPGGAFTTLPYFVSLIQ